METHMVPVVAGVVLRKENKYLLLQEKKPSAYGLWNFPAGKVDMGETFEEAAVREAKEESGFDVKLIKKIGIFQNAPERAVKHAFEAEITGGELAFPEDEILDARWFSIEEIRAMKDKLRESWILEVIEMQS